MGTPQLEERRIDRGSFLVVYRRRAAGQYDGYRLPGADCVQIERVGVNLGVYSLLADTPRDELRVLRAEIENENGFARYRHVERALTHSACMAQLPARRQSRRKNRSTSGRRSGSWGSAGRRWPIWQRYRSPWRMTTTSRESGRTIHAVGGTAAEIPLGLFGQLGFPLGLPGDLDGQNGRHSNKATGDRSQMPAAPDRCISCADFALEKHPCFIATDDEISMTVLHPRVEQSHHAHADHLLNPPARRHEKQPPLHILDPSLDLGPSSRIVETKTLRLGQHGRKPLCAQSRPVILIIIELCAEPFHVLSEVRFPQCDNRGKY